MGRARSTQRVVELNRRFTLPRDTGVAALFLALTLLMTNPLVLHLADAVEDKQDALLNTWIIAWVGHALVTDPFNFFHANIFYPYPNTLAFSETLLPQGLFALPFNLAFDNTILGYNLVLLASFFLAAYAMYLLVFDVTRARGAAIIAGTIFAFNPYNLGNLAQVQLLSFGWLPLAWLWLRRVLMLDRQSPTAEFLFALFFSLQALSSFYYAFLAVLAVALYVLWFLIRQFSVFGFRFSVFRSHVSVSRALARLALAAAFIALMVVPFFLPYLQVQREMGFERAVTESEPFSASLKLYAEVSPQNVLYGAWLAPRPPIVLGGYPLDNLFPGFIALGLAIIGIVATNDRERWFYVFLLTLAFMLSLGPRLYLAPNVPTDVTLPYRWLYDVFPLMRALRAPVRFDALVMFALAVLGGIGFARASRTFHVSHFAFHASRFTFHASCLLLIALEYLALPAARITPMPVGDALPDYVRWLRAQPRSVILELPMIASDPAQSLDLSTQYFSTYHWHTTPDGYSGFNPPRRGEIAYEMQALPAARALALIHALDVRYVVYHPPASPPCVDWQIDDLKLAGRFGDTCLYEVVSRPRDTPRLEARLFLPQPAAPSQNYLAYLILRNRRAYPFAIKPNESLQVLARWDDTAPIETRATMPLVTSSIAIVPMRLRTPALAGTHRLDLRVTGAGIGDWQWSDQVIVHDGEPARQIVLPARVTLAAPLAAWYAPGETVHLALTWYALNKIDAYYSASVRVVDTRGNKIVAQDRQPIIPTLLWRPESEIWDRFELTLPDELSPGEYTLQVKMYQADQGMEALLLDENDTPIETVTLAQIIVR
jgi:hypothetical protein